ncbi:hypothetical protein GY45DRAFT_1327070 [Cubamyces sp. BRFM 1775]|nr:hypothetical protein GY45DRAFT_1327070 [Cubamyces sp. BRFM 1775]
MQPSATTSATYGTFIQLNGLRDDSSAVFRRAVDAVRREWTLEPDVEEPLGVYFDGEELVFHDPDGIFDDLPIQSDLYGRSDDPSGTESVCQPDHPSSDTEATSDDSDGSVDNEFDDFRVVYEGPPINGAFLQMPSIRDILKYARSGYLSKYFS